MRDHDGAPESWKTRNKCSEQSPDRSGRQTGVNQPPQQCSFPLKPSDAPSIDLRIDDNCKRRPPPHPPTPGPPLPAGPAWIHVDCQKFCFVVLLVVYGGTFQLNTRLCLGTLRRAEDSWFVLRRVTADEDERCAASHYRPSALPETK